MRRIGPWQVQVLEAASFALDGGAMFGIVPRTQWSTRFLPDAEGRVRLRARCLLAVHDAGPVVLVDAGMGERWLGRARTAFGLADGGGLLSGLAGLGLSPSDVTDVVATHLHFDHAGGLVKKAEGGGLEPTFPAAKVHVQAGHLAWAREPSVRDRASFRAADFVPLAEAGLLRTHDGPGELLPDLEVRLSEGHTRAMQIPVLRGGDAPLCFPSDLIPTLAHVELPWIMAYDNQPLVTAEEKAALLSEAADGGWIIVPDHDPEASAFRVARRGSRLEPEPVEL